MQLFTCMISQFSNFFDQMGQDINSGKRSVTRPTCITGYTKLRRTTNLIIWVIRGWLDNIEKWDILVAKVEIRFGQKIKSMNELLVKQ